MQSMYEIHILLKSTFLLWLAFGIWLYGKRSYGISFFCCLAQVIALIGYEEIHINLALKKFGDDTSILIPSIIIITNWIVCTGVLITSMVAAILHKRKQDKITICLSLLQGLCYVWIFIIDMASIF
jgi:hypothetical protein